MQQARGFFQPCLVDHLPRRELEDAFAVALQLRHRQPGDRGQFGEADRAGEVGADMRVDGGKLVERRVVRLGQLQVAGNTGEPDNVALGILERPFVGQAPDGLVAEVKVQFELVGQFPTTAEHAAILLGVERAEASGEYVLGGEPEQLFAVLAPAAPGQGLVDEGVARLAVLDEEHHIVERVEQRRDGLQAAEQGRQVAGREVVERGVHGADVPGATVGIIERPRRLSQASPVSSRLSRVSMRAGLNGGRGAEGCQPNRCAVAAPHTRPWQAPMPHRLASLAWRQSLWPTRAA
ncbi:hypothetical protein D3C80_673720 [compost metagenome]